MRTLRSAWRDLRSLLLPAACARCSRALAGGEPAGGRVAPGAPTGRAFGGSALCPPCRDALPRLPRGGCARCRAAPPAPGGTRCPACRGSVASLVACVAEAPYAGEVADALQAFKYPPPGLRGLDARPQALLEALLLDAAGRLHDLPAPDRVAPVPQTPARLRQRGFNPAGLLGRGLARRLGLPFAPTLLSRAGDAPSQTGLDRAARRRNVADAFRSRPTPGARVWLVDDVVTTGATLEAAARALRRAGARQVVAICVARTPGGP